MEGLLDGVEIGQIGSRIEDFGIPDDPLFIQDECRSFGDALHIENEGIVEGAVGLGGCFIKIAKQGEVELLVFLVSAKGEDGIDADSEDLGVGVVIEGDVIAGAAELFGAGTGEGLGEEEQQHVPAFEVAEGYFLFIGIVKGEIRSLLANLNAHKILLWAKDKLKFRTEDAVFSILAIEETNVREGKLETAAGIADGGELGSKDVVAEADDEGIHLQPDNGDEGVLPADESADGKGIGVVIGIVAQLIGIEGAADGLLSRPLAGIVCLDGEIRIVIDDGPDAQ